MNIETFKNIGEAIKENSDLFQRQDFTVAQDPSTYNEEEILKVLHVELENAYVIFLKRTIEETLEPKIKLFINNELKHSIDEQGMVEDGPRL